MQDLMPPINTPDSAFHDGDPTTGQLGTIVTALWLNNVQAATRDVQLEIKNVLAKAGIQPDPKKTNQLAEAISQIIGSGNYASTAYVDNGLNKKIDKANISGQKGNDNDKVPSLNLFTTEIGKLAALGYSYSKIESDGRYQPKGNYAPAGDYATNTALNNGLDKKFDKTGGDITGRVDVSSVITASQLTAKTPENSTVQLNPINSGPRIEHRTNGGTWYIHTLPNYSGTLMQVGDGGWMRDVGVSLGGYPKLSDYRLNSIGYAYGNVSTDSFDGTNHILLNLFGYTSNAYGAQLAVTLAGKVGIRTITNNVVNPWNTMFTTANTQSDHNGNVKIPGYLERSDYPVGCPIPWPQSNAPAGYLICNGQSFNKTTYPLLAKAYPTGILPDLRAEFLRGLDAGRGIDSGRAVLSPQGDAFRAHNHSVIGEDSGSGTAYFGRGNGSRREISKDAMNLEGGTETRPRNIAFLYIVRAA